MSQYMKGCLFQTYFNLITSNFKSITVHEKQGSWSQADILQNVKKMMEFHFASIVGKVCYTGRDHEKKVRRTCSHDLKVRFIFCYQEGKLQELLAYFTQFLPWQASSACVFPRVLGEIHVHQFAAFETLLYFAFSAYYQMNHFQT